MRNKIIDYTFIPQGSTVKQKRYALYLDVGNALKNGIIDHHQPFAPKMCATMLVYRYPHLIPKDIKSIIVHNSPDLDCIASSFLVEYYLKYKKFPKYAYKLVKFINEIDFGKSPKYTVSLYSLFNIVKSKYKTDKQVLDFGHTLIKQCAKYGFDTNTTPPIYKKYITDIKKDKKVYLEDFKKSKTMQFYLPMKNKKDKKNTKCLVVSQPQSKLFKVWARNDSIHTKDGFCMLVVQLNSRRTIVSVKPDGFVYLKGLGDFLNKKEKQKREQKNIAINQPNRVGYDMPDPWYDGRSALHNYTIIDTPIRGTELDFEEILNTIVYWSKNNA